MRLESKVFSSKIIGKNLEYHILCSGEQIEIADILYVHDGNDYLQLGGIKETFQKLILEYPDIAKNIIFILLHPGDSIERWNSYHREGRLYKNFISFFTDEFVPEVERNLRNEGIKICKRGLLGDSLAGNIGINIALQKPDFWTHLLLQSAAISKEVIEDVQKLRYTGWKVYQRVGIHEDQFVSSITNEKLMILTRNRELHSAFVQKNLQVDYKELNTDHLWSVWKKDLPNALVFFINH